MAYAEYLRNPTLTESRILDVSCGIGRHAIDLAESVVGYDPSSFFLEKAKQRAKTEIGNDQKYIKFYEGEINHIVETLSNDTETEFNAIISINSLGYTNTEDDLMIFLIYQPLEPLWSLKQIGIGE